MAYNIGYDLIVNDENCRTIGVQYIKIAQEFEDRLNEYINILNSVTANAIRTGVVSDNLAEYKQCVEGFKNQLSEISEAANDILINFLVDMDAADSYLY